MGREKTEYIESKARARARIKTRRTLEVMYVVLDLALVRCGVEMFMSVEHIYLGSVRLSSPNGSRYDISGTAYPPAETSRKSPNTNCSAPNCVETSHTLTDLLVPNNSHQAGSVFIRNNIALVIQGSYVSQGRSRQIFSRAVGRQLVPSGCTFLSCCR